MGLIQFRPPWTKQPQGIEVDWSNPLAAKARAIALPIPGGARAWARGYAEQLTYSNGSGVDSAAGLAGIGIGSTSASTNVHRLHSTGNSTATAWESPSSAATWAAVLVRFGNNANGNAPIFGNDDASVSPYSAWGLMDGSGSGTARFSCSAGGTYRSLDVASWLDNGVVRAFVGRYDGAELAGFRSGVKHTSAIACSGSLTYPNSANRGPAIGNFWNFLGSSRSFNGRVFLAVLWDVALTDAEIKEFSDNPWQLFQPRTIHIPLAAAGGAIAIDGAVGNAVAAGVTGAPGVSIEVAGAVGNAAAAGVTGTPAVSIDISGVVGGAVAAGIAGTPGVSIDITGAVGNAVAAGVSGAADVGGNITIDGAVGNAVAAGVAGLPGVAITIDGSVGNATAAGITGQADIGILISGSVGNAAAAGVTGALSLDIVVPGVVGDAVAAGVAGIVTLSSGTGATAAEIVAALMAEEIETGVSVRMALRIILAAVSGPTAGIGTNTERYYSSDGLVARITATFDGNSNRTSVALDDS